MSGALLAPSRFESHKRSVCARAFFPHGIITLQHTGLQVAALQHHSCRTQSLCTWAARACVAVTTLPHWPRCECMALSLLQPYVARPQPHSC